MKCFVFLTILATLLLSPVKTMAQELVLYYPFEGTGDKAVDNSGKGNDGDIKGAKRVPSGEIHLKTAMEFDGKDDMILVKDSKSLDIDTKISFVMWVKKATETGGPCPLADDCPRIISRPGDIHEFAMDCGAVKRGDIIIDFVPILGWTSVGTIDLNWHHLALTYDGEKFMGYIDGNAVFERDSPGKIVYTGDFYIGTRHTLSEYYAGLLDELAVYDGVLEPAKIKEIMTEGVLGQFAVFPHGKLASTWGSIKAKY